jgi:hypothetical protein
VVAAVRQLADDGLTTHRLLRLTQPGNPTTNHDSEYSGRIACKTDMSIPRASFRGRAKINDWVRAESVSVSGGPGV